MSRLRAMGGRLGAMPAKLALAPKLPDPFYRSKEWRSLVARIKRQRGAWCERCGSNERLIADHIVERKDGGADLDEGNIELLCQLHHAAKTAEARRARAAGRSR